MTLLTSAIAETLRTAALDPRIGKPAMMVLAAILGRLSDDSPTIRLAVIDIAGTTKLNRRSVERALAELRGGSYVSVQRRGETRSQGTVNEFLPHPRFMIASARVTHANTESSLSSRQSNGIPSVERGGGTIGGRRELDRIPVYPRDNVSRTSPTTRQKVADCTPTKPTTRQKVAGCTQKPAISDHNPPESGGLLTPEKSQVEKTPTGFDFGSTGTSETISVTAKGIKATFKTREGKEVIRAFPPSTIRDIAKSLGKSVPDAQATIVRVLEHWQLSSFCGSHRDYVNDLLRDVPRLEVKVQVAAVPQVSDFKPIYDWPEHLQREIDGIPHPTH
jgi:hypothetical protein